MRWNKLIIDNLKIQVVKYTNSELAQFYNVTLKNMERVLYKHKIKRPRELVIQHITNSNKKRADEKNSNWKEKDGLDRKRQRNALCFRKKHAEIRMKCLDLLGNKCVRCGFTDKRALNIDHVNGGGSKEAHSFKNGYEYLKKILEAIKNRSDKYQLLCSNCNQIKKHENNEVAKKYL